MILSKVYEDAERRLERNEITLGEFERLVDIEVIEPKHGEWIVHEARTEINDGFIDFFPTEYECSNCGLKQSMYFINSKPSNFCPNCGADMRNCSEKPNNSTISKMEQVDKLQTKDYCDICNHKGCEYCISDSRNPYCIPSNYEPRTEGNE